MHPWQPRPIFALLALLAALTPIATAKPNAVLLQEFIFIDAPFAQCHASTIEETPAGLIAAWFGGTREGRNDVGIWLARHRDGKWTTPVEVATGFVAPKKRLPCWNPVLFLPRKGPLMLFYKVGPSPSRWWTMLMFSHDAGESWSTPKRLPKGILGPVRNRPVQLPDGTILCGTSTEHDGWEVQFESTKDLGKTWRKTPSVANSKRYGCIQPTILIHADGTLQALCRSKSHVITETFSRDGGKTWSPMSLTTLPNPNSGISGITLKDGRHLLAYNHTTRVALRPRGREMLNVAISKDGKRWKKVLTLENEPLQEFSYPYVIQSRDGRVHITYTWKRRRIKHVVLDPNKLR